MRFNKRCFFSNSTCLLGQHSHCSSAGWIVLLSEKICTKPLKQHNASDCIYLSEEEVEIGSKILKYFLLVYHIFEIRLYGEYVRGGVDVPEDDEKDEDVHDGPHHGEAGVRPRVVAEIIASLLKHKHLSTEE